MSDTQYIVKLFLQFFVKCFWLLQVNSKTAFLFGFQFDKFSTRYVWKLNNWISDSIFFIYRKWKIKIKKRLRQLKLRSTWMNMYMYNGDFSLSKKYISYNLSSLLWVWICQMLWWFRVPQLQVWKPAACAIVINISINYSGSQFWQQMDHLYAPNLLLYEKANGLGFRKKRKVLKHLNSVDQVTQNMNNQTRLTNIIKFEPCHALISFFINTKWVKWKIASIWRKTPLTSMKDNNGSPSPSTYIELANSEHWACLHFSKYVGIRRHPERKSN